MASRMFRHHFSDGTSGTLQRLIVTTLHPLLPYDPVISVHHNTIWKKDNAAQASGTFGGTGGCCATLLTCHSTCKEIKGVLQRWFTNAETEMGWKSLKTCAMCRCESRSFSRITSPCAEKGHKNGSHQGWPKARDQTDTSGFTANQGSTPLAWGAIWTAPKSKPSQSSRFWDGATEQEQQKKMVVWNVWLGHGHHDEFCSKTMVRSNHKSYVYAVCV